MRKLADKIDARYPFTLVDIGVMGGIARKWDILGDVPFKVVAFEADDREYAKLVSSGRISYLNFLVHGKREEVTFHISRESGKSSIFPPNMPFLSQFPGAQRFEVVKQMHFPADKVCSLDDLYQEGFLKDLDFLKLDTEGSELFILQGGRSTILPKVFGVQLEAEFVEKCQGQPLFRHVDEFMASQGFVLMDLRRQFWKRKKFFDYVGKGQMVFGDVLYFKNVDTLRNNLAVSKDVVCIKSKIYKCILVCMVYKIFDYAAVLAELALEEQWLSKEDFDDIIQIIKMCARRNDGVYFPGRPLAYTIVWRLAKILQPKSFNGFADGDTYIGNIRDV